MNFISSLAVYSSLGYKSAVEACYEEKLREAWREAQQDCNYATDDGIIIQGSRGVSNFRSVSLDCQDAP